MAETARTIGILSIVKHVFLNSIAKFSRVSNEMFSVSAVNGKHEFGRLDDYGLEILLCVNS